jgi:hypothetical protein
MNRTTPEPAPGVERQLTYDQLDELIGDQYTVPRNIAMKVLNVQKRQLRNLVAECKLDQIRRGGPITAASLRKLIGLT